MSATPADDVQTSPAWNCGCKGTKKIAFLQENCDFCLVEALKGLVFSVWWRSDEVMRGGGKEVRRLE